MDIEERQRLLKEVLDHFSNEDNETRERQLRQWKKLKYYWDGFAQIWWSEVAHDWRIYDMERLTSSNNEGDYYDKPINVFKAYLESIIAALSITVPAVKCYPDNADSSDDLETARAGDSIAKIVYRHNDVSLLWLHALYIYCTEGLTACYNYTKEDESYGTYEVEQYEDSEETTTSKVCPICQLNLSDEPMTDEARNMFDPSGDDALGQDIIEGQELCPNCLTFVLPTIQEDKVIVPRLVGKINKPKGRQCLEVYGGLFVKVPIYAKKQSDCPYLIFSYESHYAEVLERFPHLRNKFDTDGKYSGGTGDNDYYSRWARTSTQYRGAEPTSVVTVRNGWLRPCSFNILKDEDDIKALKKLYPNGVRVVFINDSWAEDENESLDDHWTLSNNPLSDYLHHEPLGMGLVSVQDITSLLISLILQTVEHGIPQTFADDGVIDFVKYSQTEATPGMLYPAKPKTGKSLGDAFHEVKTASLSGEVLPFGNKIQELGQLASGALPSLFGGDIEGSKTAAQYSMSRAQSLQRLQIPWKMFAIWWKTIFGKVIPSYIKEVAHDERMVEKDVNGNFINIFVRRSQLLGKIGSIELETAEQLPVSWGQNKDAIMQLLQSNNPQVIEALTDPQNIPLLATAIGLPEFKIPGEDDREKQLEEIRLLLEGEPIIGMSMEGMEEEVPSIDIEPTIDNNIIQSDICRAWAVSPAGRLSKTENPLGYKNVLLHMQRHVTVVQAMQAMNAAQAAQPNSEEAASTEEPVNG